MPFTLSHAAAALPFRKVKPVWPALVIGTFAPDLQYFIQLTDEDRSGHHYPDVLLFTLPVALLALWLFEWVVKGPAIGLLPGPIERRLQDKVAPLSFRGWRQFARIVFWIAVGTLTHLVWDQFTHPYTRAAEFLPLLKTHISFPYWKHTTVAGLLQDASTILGFLALCIWCLAWYRRTRPSPTAPTGELSPLTKISVVAAMMFIATGVGYVLAWLMLADRLGPLSRQVRIAITFLAMTQIFCVEMLIYGTARTLRNRQHLVATRQVDEPAVKSG